MEDKDIWLIHLKASLGMRSTMNMDGSSYALAIGVVPADSVLEAIPLLKDYLNEDHMDILDVWKCERYVPDQFAEENEEHHEIRKAIELVKQRQKVVLACGITSEALEEEDEDD